MSNTITYKLTGRNNKRRDNNFHSKDFKETYMNVDLDNMLVIWRYHENVVEKYELSDDLTWKRTFKNKDGKSVTINYKLIMSSNKKHATVERRQNGNHYGNETFVRIQ